MTAYLSSLPWLPGAHGTHSVARFVLGGGTLSGACGKHPGIACRLVWDVAHSQAAAHVTDEFLAGPVKMVLRIAFVLALALVTRLIAHRMIRKLTKRAADPGPGLVDAALRLRGERRYQRAQALGSLLANIASVVIFGIAGVTIAGYVGLNLAPVLASAGVLGLAVGFGAQSLVRDFLSGIFMLLEDQYGVGDLIDAGVAAGTVEAVGLRTTRLRDVNGVVWHIRNGTISRIGNQSQGWSRAVVDFPVGYHQDLGRVRAVMKEAAVQMWTEPGWRDVILEEPEVWGVESVYSDAVMMRLVAKTVPVRQTEVARVLRERVKAALDVTGADAGPGIVAAPGSAAQEPGTAVPPPGVPVPPDQLPSNSAPAARWPGSTAATATAPRGTAQGSQPAGGPPAGSGDGPDGS